MGQDLGHLMRQSYAEVSLRTAKKRLTKLVDYVAWHQSRLLITDRGDPFACIVPISDVAFLTQLESRLDTDTGLRAIEEWEARGKQVMSMAQLMRRFAVKGRPSNQDPVVIAATADVDLAAASTDQRPLVAEIGRLGRHPAVKASRRAGAIGEIRGLNIERYRVIFLIEKARLVVLRISANLVQGLLP